MGEVDNGYRNLPTAGFDHGAYRGDADDLSSRMTVLREHEFRTSFQRRVWRRHCRGLSVTEIADALESHRSRVHRALQNVRDEWNANKQAPDLYALAKSCDATLMRAVLQAMRYARSNPDDAEALIEQAEALLDL
jgi:IS30 family transposase